jgi:phage-related protein (TIGR01555 family)
MSQIVDLKGLPINSKPRGRKSAGKNRMSNATGPFNGSGLERYLNLSNGNNDTGNEMLSGIFDTVGSYGGGAPLSQVSTLAYSSNYAPLITMNRVLTTQAYMTHGVLQTAIDMPVLDAFRGGLKIQSELLDEDDLSKLKNHLRTTKTLHEIMDTFRWARLYGGAGLIINTAQDPLTPLNYRYVDYPDLPLEFVAADRWELILNVLMLNEVEFPYNYYGQPLNKDRVLRVIGIEAPSFLRPRLQGWGMSALERMIRDINMYVKAQQVLFQLLDEAKIDVWRLMGFNDTILSDMAHNLVNQRLFYANMGKNYHKAILMDKEDEWEQRQISFSGFGEIMQQLRMGIAAALRIPMTKLFGMSASGFNSGEDDIENYNAMIESEIREPALDMLYPVIKLTCRHLFGFEPEDLIIEFMPLRVLGEVDQEAVRTSKQARFIQLFQSDLMTGEELYAALKQEGIFTMETEVGKGLREALPMGRAEEAVAFGKQGGGGAKESGSDGKKAKGTQ